MPFPNEHACHLKDSAECDGIERQNSWAKHEGKRMDAIWCVKQGALSLQGIRYPKGIWTPEDAGEH